MILATDHDGGLHMPENVIELIWWILIVSAVVVVLWLASKD